MLFVSNNPVQVQILDDRKIIILTQNKIMFSQLDFIQEYLAMPLITLNPKKMYYEPSIMQVMIVSQTTLEVYFCDWKTQIKLIRVLILNNQIVQGVSYQKQQGWQVYGSMHQYEPTRITFHKCKNKEATKILSKCFVNKDKYVLTNERLQKSERGKQFKQVWWKDRMMVIKNCNYQIQMKGQNTLDKRRDIICINSSYALIICKFQVLITIMQPVIIYSHSNLLISNIQKDVYTTIKKYENNNFVDLGTISKKSGTLCGAFLYENELALLIYDQKQIHFTSLPLVQQKTQNQDNKKKPQNKKKIFQTISRIMQESHQDGSQLIQKDDKSNIKNDKTKLQKDYLPQQKPLIRDIVVNDQEIKANSLNQGTSQVLSRSGIDQIQRIDEDEGQQINHQLSFQLKNDKDKKENIFSSLKNKSRSTKFKRQAIYPDNMSDLSSIKRKKKKESSKQKVSFQNEKTQQLSQKSKSSKRNNSKSIRQKTQNKNQTHNVSVNSNQSFQDHAETPAFGFENLSGENKWGFFQKQWDQAAKDEINQQQQQQMQESLCINDQKSILKFMPQNISKKVEVFKPQNCILTTEIYNKIQKSSYCFLIQGAIQNDPDKIQQYLKIFLRNVLEQPQAPLFFEKNIRTFNPQFTQDKIKKLFGSQLNNKQLKIKMTQALQLFKLSEVPSQVLSFPPDFIKVIRIIYKDVYIQDLLKPTQTTISYLLDSYFNIQNFSQQIITIEDQQIDISHPRNMLNVLLYLNQYLGLKIELVIKAYCAKIIQQDHLQILKKITLKQNIFEICEVSRSVLDDVVIERFNHLLNESVQNAQYLWSLIQFLSKDLEDQYRIRLAIITELNKSNIIFSLEVFINIKKVQNDIYSFLEKIIIENSCKNLSNLKFDSIYRSLYWLQEEQKISNVTFQYIELIKTLAQKFCEKKWFYYGLKLLDTIKPKVKLSFIAKLLYSYLNSKFINRLINLTEQFQSLQSIFFQLMSDPDTDVTILPNDKIQIPQYSRSLSCSWTKFLQIFDRNLQGPLEIKVLVFCQINIANQFYLLLQENQKRKFQKFLLEIQQSLIVELEDINQNDLSLNPKGATSLKFYQNQQIQEQTLIATSTIGREDILIQDDHQSKKKIVYKSMTLIDHYNQLKSSKLARRNSDKKYNDDTENNQDLMRIKLLVSRRQIIQQLTEIYEKKEHNTFIRSLQLVDHEKIKLYHTQVLKSIINKETQYPITRIIPFNVFITSQTQDAFQLTRQKIKSEINILNFWVIYTMIQLIFKKGQQVSKIFIEKCVTYFRSDNYNEVISSIINITNPKFSEQYKIKIVQAAKDYRLENIQKTLNYYFQDQIEII